MNQNNDERKDEQDPVALDVSGGGAECARHNAYFRVEEFVNPAPGGVLAQIERERHGGGLNRMTVGDGHQGSSLVDRGLGVNLTISARARPLFVVCTLSIASCARLLGAAREMLGVGVVDLDQGQAVRG